MPLCFTSKGVQAVDWTYDVEYKASQVVWGSRWESLLQSFNIVQAAGIYASLSNILPGVVRSITVVAAAKVNSARLDFARPNSVDDYKVIPRVSRWKLIHGEVFSPPPWPTLLAVLIGSGAQLFCLFAGTLILGFLSSGITTMHSLVIIACLVCGYCVAKFRSSFQGNYRRPVNIGLNYYEWATIVLGPLAQSFALWAFESRDAVLFSVLLVNLFWMLVSSLLIDGKVAHLVDRQQKNEYPQEMNQTLTEIPVKPRRVNV